MKYLIITLIIFSSANAQKQYLNSDGTISSEYYRNVFLEAFKQNETDDSKYEMEDKFLVMISKSECDNSVSNEDYQNKTFAACISQLLTRIRAFQSIGFKDFEAAEFDGIIFKTNYICSSETRRYHFKFTINELKNFPEYIDLDELYSYIVEKNHNSNIIYIKNSK